MRAPSMLYGVFHAPVADEVAVIYPASPDTRSQLVVRPMTFQTHQLCTKQPQKGPARQQILWRLRLRDELPPGGILQSSPWPDSGKTARDTGTESESQVTESTGVGSQLFRTCCVPGDPVAHPRNALLV